MTTYNQTASHTLTEHRQAHIGSHSLTKPDTWRLMNTHTRSHTGTYTHTLIHNNTHSNTAQAERASNGLAHRIIAPHTAFNGITYSDIASRRLTQS